MCRGDAGAASSSLPDSTCCNAKDSTASASLSELAMRHGGGLGKAVEDAAALCMCSCRLVNTAHGPPVRSAGGSCCAGGVLLMLKGGSGKGACPPGAMLRDGRHPAAT